MTAGTGCRAQMRRGVLHLTLDAPGAPVNVLTLPILSSLADELSRGLARGARAVVLRSGKPGSFINGAQLLLAASLRGRAVRDYVGAFRRLYAQFAAAPVPTLCLVEGSCFGCGMELSLRFDYRLAADAAEARFSMTEFRDYAIVTAFGGTQMLSPLVGLPAGMDLLLGAEPPPRQLQALGLVDRVAPPGRMEGELERFLGELEERGWPKRAPRPLPSREALVKAQASIARGFQARPGPDRALARTYLKLATLPMRPGYSLRDGMAAELRAFLGSLRKAEAREAISFFFIRQASRAGSLGSAAPAARRNAPLPARPSRALLRRKLGAKGVALITKPREPRGPQAFMPLPARPLVELANVPRSGVRVAFELLERSGLSPVVTSPRGSFLAARLAAAYAKAGVGADRALLAFGFAVLPEQLSKRSRSAGGSVRRALFALAAAAVSALDEGAVAGPAQVDTMIHSLLGFPVARGSLLRHLVVRGEAAFLRGLAGHFPGAVPVAERVLKRWPAFYGKRQR